MKLMFSLNVVLFVLIVRSLSLAQSLNIDFYLDKKEFLYGESIDGIVVLNNHGNDINIPHFGFMYDFSELGAELFDENNESLKKNKDMTLHYDLSQQQSLKKDDSFCDFLNISFVFGFTDDKITSSQLRYRSRALAEGNYKLIVTYLDPHDKNKRYQKELEFNVVRPTATNDIEIFSALSKAVIDFNTNRSDSLYYQDLENILKNNFNSDYRILIYLRVIFELYLNELKAEALNYLEKMFEEYPNTVATYMISSLFWDSDKDFFHKPEIQTIIKNSKCSGYLSYYLNSYKLITN